MQKNQEAILLEYRDADIDRRLHMFLAYRELRGQFRAIDCSETGDQWTVDKASPKLAGLVRYVMKSFVRALNRFMCFPDLGITTRELKGKTVPLQDEKGRRQWGRPFF